MAAEEPWDVIIVGAGNAALCAALSAAEQGVKVLVLEKATLEDRGGNSTFTAGGFRFCHDGVEDLEQVQVQGLEGNSHEQHTVSRRIARPLRTCDLIQLRPTTQRTQPSRLPDPTPGRSPHQSEGRSGSLCKSFTSAIARSRHDPDAGFGGDGQCNPAECRSELLE